MLHDLIFNIMPIVLQRSAAESDYFCVTKCCLCVKCTRCTIFHLMASFYCILKHFYFYSNICQKTWIDLSIWPSDFYEGPNRVLLRESALCQPFAFLPRYPPVDCNHILLVFYTSFVSYEGENNDFHLVLVNRFCGSSANFALIIYNNLSVTETPEMRWTDVQGWLSHYIKFFNKTTIRQNTSVTLYPSWALFSNNSVYLL